MNLKRSFLIVCSCLFFILGLFSCGEESPEQSNFPSKRAPKRVFIVLDNSGSVNRENISLIQEKMDDLFGILKRNFSIYLFTTDVTDRSVQHPVASIEFYHSSTSTPAERRQRRAEKVSKHKYLRDTLVVNLMTEHPNKTCILSAFKSIYKFIQSSESNDDYLLIFSDMMECCKFGCAENVSGFKRLFRDIDKYRLNEYSLSDYVSLDHIAVAYVTHSLDEKNSEVIESESFNHFWTEAFKQMGYADKPIFGTSIGRWLQEVRKMQ